jgi:putative ABC transport system ATP-binding protein
VIAQRVVLDGVDLDVAAGESVAVMGPSGSGKTTLLHCIAGLRSVSDGEVIVANTCIGGASERQRARFRLEHVGMVFQFGELLPELTLAENVALPLMLRGVRSTDRVARNLDTLGLGERGESYPGELSGGEVQRAAIARAVVGDPTLLLADEPTGALDEDMSVVACDLLLSSARRIGAALVVATHDPLVSGAMDRTVRLRRGKLEAS